MTDLAPSENQATVELSMRMSEALNETLMGSRLRPCAVTQVMCQTVCEVMLAFLLHIASMGRFWRLFFFKFYFLL